MTTTDGPDAYCQRCAARILYRDRADCCICGKRVCAACRRIVAGGRRACVGCRVPQEEGVSDGR